MLNSLRIAKGVAVYAAIACWLATAGAAGATFPAWTTYRHDAGRSGIDPSSGSPVAPSRLWQTPHLDGNVYAQPLVYGSRVYVATENDSVYALDAATGAVIWRQNVGTPVPDVQTSGCGNIGDVGITSTPVIDPATGRIYAVADTWNGSDPATIHHWLVGFDLASGNPAPGLPIVVDAPGSKPAYELQRPGLALDAGKIIIGFGGNAGDCGPYNGWLVAAPESGAGPLAAFEVEHGSRMGAIWGSGNAPAIDAAGAVWVATGNGDGTTYAYQESVLRLNPQIPQMQLLDSWAPADWATLDQGDTDIGSSEPVLLPGGLVFQIGKSGIGYLLATDHLGGMGADPVYSAAVCGSAFGGGIYANGVIYVACQGGMQALSLNAQARTFAAVAGWSAPSATGFAAAAAGLIWSAGAGSLYGLDPATGKVRFSPNIGTVGHFASPSAADGRLFITNTDQITAFRIATPAPPSATSTTVTGSPNPGAPGTAVTFTATVSPAPDAGTVAFTDGGSPIPGCTAVALTAAGVATCTTRFPAAGSHSVGGAYSGDAYYAPSQSAPFAQIVQVPPTGRSPALSHLTVHVAGRSLTVTFTLSEPAAVTIAIARMVHGRLAATRCLARAVHGKRCTIALRTLTVHRHGHRGVNTLVIRLGRMPSARYTATVTARDAKGRRGRAKKVAFVIRLH